MNGIKRSTKTKMKKIILEILLGLGLPAATFHTQLAGVFTTEKTVTKQITYSIQGDSNYNAPAYNKTVATVHVVVFTVKNHRQHIVWQKMYDTMPIKKYPVAYNCLRETVKVKNISDSKEKLFITYIITYDTNGGKMQVENGTALLQGEKEGKLVINI